jgi:hypothetical protein
MIVNVYLTHCILGPQKIKIKIKKSQKYNRRRRRRSALGF